MFFHLKTSIERTYFPQKYNFSIFLYHIETMETHLLKVTVDMTLSQLLAASMAKFSLPANGEATL